MRNRCVVKLGRDEEKIAQLLTRDAWMSINQGHVEVSPFSTSKIPRMPQGGAFEFVADSELLRYYLSNADIYRDELAELGWGSRRYGDACEGFRSKVEAAADLPVRSGSIGTQPAGS